MSPEVGISFSEYSYSTPPHSVSELRLYAGSKALKRFGGKSVSVFDVKMPGGRHYTAQMR